MKDEAEIAAMHDQLERWSLHPIVPLTEGQQGARAALRWVLSREAGDREVLDVGVGR